LAEVVTAERGALAGWMVDAADGLGERGVGAGMQNVETDEFLKTLSGRMDLLEAFEFWLIHI
jgi:hypothetical protein